MSLFFDRQRRRARNARDAGDRARDVGRWPEAAVLYRLWLLDAPADAAIWIQLGHVLGEIPEFESARIAYAAAATLQPDDADLELCRGHLERRAGNLDAARGFYRRSAEIDGNAAAAALVEELTEPEPVDDPAQDEDDVVEPEAMPPTTETVVSDPEADQVSETAKPAPDPEPDVELPSETAYEIETAAESDAETVRVGRFDGWFEREVSGYVLASPASLPVIEFRVDGRVVGRARARLPRAAPDESGFRAVVDIEGDGVFVSAHLLPGGEELDNSPVLLHPRRTVAAGHAISASAVRAIVAKPFVMPASGEVAIFVAHAPMGRLKPHVRPYMAALGAAGVAVLLVVVADRPLSFAPGERDLAAGILVRENIGYDFAAWAHALKLHPELYGANVLLLANDSVFGPVDTPRFARMLERVRTSTADLIGLTESHEYGWHVQSYFLACKPRLLASWAFHHFVNGVYLLGTKDEVVRAFEVPFASRMAAAGMATETLFPSHLAINPSLFGWRELIADGFPFAKILLLRGLFPEADTHNWRDTLATAGFDLALIDATIASLEERGPEGPAHDLLAPSVIAEADTARPLKVAYLGPWNYDNGLGQASRELLCALLRTGASLNLHPIARPFHIHRPLSPAAELRDFDGPADVAIVHLNPDSWHLLTDEQLAVVHGAGRRIGYWVWEMDRLPPAWHANLGKVDRVWAPSAYCADVFAREVDVPVDVIPHPVPVPPVHRVDRAATLGAFGIDPARRVILYVFDGSSYLVRKNPAALVRAFDAAGLADAGWTLLLKTKHLHDRRDAGETLSALVADTDGVVLADRVLSANDLADLLAAIDVYASPHASEGFGLTVAEAMAAGKPVVATDFSGTRDFLDADCGYPVRAHPWMLAEDHGHYLAGYGWSRVDEPALVRALQAACAAIDDPGIGERARARIADRLSYATVARAIDTSLAALSQQAHRHPPVADVIPNFAGHARFADLVSQTDFVPVPLAADGALAAAPPDGGDEDWLVFAPGDAIADPSLFERLRIAAAERPDAAMLYGDDVAAEAMPADRVRLKPAFDGTLLAAQDYIGSPVAIRRNALDRLGGLAADAGRAVLFDLVLRAAEGGLSIARVPHALLGHAGRRPATAPAERRAILEALPRYADGRFLDGKAPGLLSYWGRFDAEDQPPVTLVIPTRRTMLPGAATSYVVRLLDAIELVDWRHDRLTVVIGDDIADPPDWADRPRPYSLRRIATPRAVTERFNYASKMNHLWREARDEQIVFLNDDVLPLTPHWLKALQSFAVQRDVGGVGARLVYEDGRLQHAGLAPLFGAVAHLWLGWPAVRPTAHDWAWAQREPSMVTGAVFATRRSVLDRIGGFDERLSLEFNDVDLCLRLRALGYRIVYNPEAELIHAEKASRGEAPPPGEEMALFLSRWGRWLDSDPAFHPGYRRDRLDLAAADDPGAWYR